MITGSSDAIMDNVYLNTTFVMAGVIVMMEVMNGDLTVVCKLSVFGFLLVRFSFFGFFLIFPKEISVTELEPAVRNLTSYIKCNSFTPLTNNKLNSYKFQVFRILYF